jgi:hypothetical protein
MLPKVIICFPPQVSGILFLSYPLSKTMTLQIFIAILENNTIPVLIIMQKRKSGLQVFYFVSNPSYKAN